MTRLKRAVAVSRSRFGRRWAAELPAPGGVGWGPTPWAIDFDRGFVSHLDVDTGATLAEHADELFRATPVRHLRVKRLGGAGQLAAVAGRPGIRSIRIGTARLAAVPDILDEPYLDHIPHCFLPNSLQKPEHAANLAARYTGRMTYVEGAFL